MKNCCIILMLFLVTGIASQNKKMWAKSFINKESPKIKVQGWISEKPELTDKFILIDFWATWCGPCRKAIPEMNTYSELFKDRLVVIGISDESKKTINKMKSPVMKYFSAFDTKRRLYKKYKVRGIPHVVLIDPKGIVRWEGFPFLAGHELTKEVIQEIINKYDDENK